MLARSERHYTRQVLRNTYHCREKSFFARDFDFAPGFPARQQAFLSLSYGQRAARIPGQWAVTVKSGLHISITACQRRFGGELFSFWPRTLTLPAEHDAVQALLAAGSGAWIVKRNLSRGRGVELVEDAAQLAACTARLRKKKRVAIAQQYVADSLLIDGFKCSLRIYALVTSIDPLRVYMFPEGIVRICSSRHASGGKYAHIDSIDINQKRAKHFARQRAQDIPGIEGLRMLAGQLLDWVAAQRGDATVRARVLDDIADVVYRALFAGVDNFKRETRTYELYPGNVGWELFGFDIIVDDSLRSWLLEVNAMPSLAPHTRLEETVKLPMLEQLFRLVDCTRDAAQHCAQLVARRYPHFRSVQVAATAGGQLAVDGPPSLARLVGEHLPLLRCISKRDFHDLVDMELELERCGSWLPLFLPERLQRSPHLMEPDRSHIAYRWLAAGFHTQLFDQPVTVNQ